MNRLSIVAAIVFSACVTRPPVGEPGFAGRFRNACLPEAAAMAEGLTAAGVQAKVLVIVTPRWSHAVTVYLYPAGQNRLWAWDSTWKSNNLRAWWNDAEGVARAWVALCGDGEQVSAAKFIE